MSDFSPPPLPPEPPPPDPPPPPGPPPRQGIPWDDRDRLGLATAFVETLKKVLLDPVAFYRAMPVSGGLGGPLGYGMLIGYFGVVVSAFYQAILQSFGGGLMGEIARRGDLDHVAQSFSGIIGFVFALVIGPVFLLIALFVGAGITHLMLMLLGGAKRDYETTFRVSCFAQSAAVLAVVPFCGQLVQGIYQIVLTIIGLSEAHQISRMTAALAVLLPILLVCCCCGLTAGMMFGSLAGLAGGLPR